LATRRKRGWEEARKKKKKKKRKSKRGRGKTACGFLRWGPEKGKTKGSSKQNIREKASYVKKKKGTDKTNERSFGGVSARGSELMLRT